VLPPEELLGFAAVRLFVERARARRTDFALTARNAAAVVRICHHLDGIPLAIELAAARIDTMPVEGIAARLDDCFRLLTGGPRTALPRQKTLRATLDWSYDLLSARERIILPRLSVFAGGWTIEAAEAVCAGEGVESKDVLDLLAGMVHKSLVLLEERGNRRAGSARYRLLDTVRQYAREILLAGGTDTVVRRRFRAWCLAFAERADAMIEGLEQETWLDRIDTELDNLRAVMARSLTDAEVTEAGMRLATALRWFWALRLRIDEGRWWLEATLAAGGAVSVAARAAALYAAGRLADLHGDRERAHALYTQCFPLFQQLGDNNRLAYTLHWLSWHAHRLGDHERGAALREESLRLFRESGDKQGFAQTLIMLGSDAQQQGDFVQAAAYWEEALTLLRELGVTWNLSVLLMELAGVARVRGDYAGAESYLAEGLTLYQELGFMDGIVAAHSYLGEVAAAQGELDQAAAWFQRGLALCGDDERQKVHLPQYRYGLGNVARLRGDYRRAIALFEESLTEIREAGVPGPLARVLTDLGYAVHDQGDAARAQALYRESLALLGSKGYKPHIARNLEGLATVSARHGQPERAARQFGVAAALRDLMGAPLPPSERSAIESSLAAVRAALGVDTFEAAWTVGRTLGLDEAVAEALRIGTAIV
jgi:tetratricopeptide (TPR) repeat protein